jgi:hypothetical protein
MGRLAELDDVDTAARYIGNYLNMQSYHVRKYIMSDGWVFRGWVSWSRWFKKHYGVYPDQMYPGILVKLARMPKRERDEITMPELMKDEKLNRVKITLGDVNVRKINTGIRKLKEVKLY